MGPCAGGASSADGVTPGARRSRTRLHELRAGEAVPRIAKERSRETRSSESAPLRFRAAQCIARPRCDLPRSTSQTMCLSKSSGSAGENARAQSRRPDVSSRTSCGQIEHLACLRALRRGAQR